MGLRHREGGVWHVQRLKDALTQKVRQALTGHHLNHPAQHIGPTAVFEGAARLKNQGQPRQLLGEIGQAAFARTNAQLGVLALHGCTTQKLVGHASGVAQQVMNRGGPTGGLIPGPHRLSPP